MDGRSFPRRTFILTLLGLAAAAAPVWAGNDTWTVTGQPSGGQVFKVAVNPTTPNIIYAVANPGVFESADGGAHWGIALAMDDQDGVDIAVDPVKPANVYVAGHDDGIWKSADGGKTWSHLNGIPTAHVVVVDPVNEGVVYTIANGCDVYKSVDGGATWNLSDTGISGLTGNADAYGTQIAVDPVNPQLLYLATQVGDFQSSTGARGGSPLSGLYSSMDGGAHWTQNLPTLAFADVVIDPNNDQNVYADNYASTNAGGTWAPVTGMPTDLSVTAVEPGNSQVMWAVEVAVGAGNVWTSTDQGADWSQVTMPYENSVYNLVYDPVTPTMVYASSMAFGVYKSTDGGSTWAQSTNGLYGVYAYDMLMDSSGAMYIGSQGAGVLKSTDQGASWAMMNNGFTVGSGVNGIWLNGLVEDPTTPNTLYAITELGGPFKTTDGGASWSQLNGINVSGMNALAVDPEQAQTVYVGAGAGHVFKSVSGGAAWTQSVRGLPADAILALAVDPADSNVVFAGTLQSGLFESTDGGATWAESDNGMPKWGVWCMAIDPNTPTTMYACVPGGGIYKSTDGGQTWSNAGSDLPDYAFRVLQIDPSNTAVIYAAIPDGFMYYSTDAGIHWTELGGPTASSSMIRRTEAVATSSPKTRSSSSGTLTISAIAVDPHSDNVYGAASHSQVYVYGNSNLPSGSGASSGSSGGGGAFSLLAGLLLGLGLLRRRAG